MLDTQELLAVELHATKFPGIRFEDRSPGGLVYEPVHVGVQRGEEVIDLVRGDARSSVFRATFRVAQLADGSPNFLGPYAKGTPRERFFYLSWGVLREGCGFASFRRAKIPLWKLNWQQVSAALAAGAPIRGDVILTDARGGPSCATLKDELFRWRD